MLPKVPPEFKLAKILRQMALGDVNMRATDRPLDHRPEAFDGVRVVAVARPFLFRVVDRSVNEAFRRQLFIRMPFVGADRRTGRNVLNDVRLNGVTLHVRDDTGDHVAAALDNPEHKRLAKRATALATFAVPAKIRLVQFNLTGQLAAFQLGHMVERFSQALDRVGVPNELVLVPLRIHGFDLYGAEDPAVYGTFEKVGRFVTAHAAP